MDQQNDFSPSPHQSDHQQHLDHIDYWRRQTDYGREFVITQVGGKCLEVCRDGCDWCSWYVSELKKEKKDETILKFLPPPERGKVTIELLPDFIDIINRIKSTHDSSLGAVISVQELFDRFQAWFITTRHVIERDAFDDPIASEQSLQELQLAECCLEFLDLQYLHLDIHCEQYDGGAA